MEFQTRRTFSRKIKLTRALSPTIGAQRQFVIKGRTYHCAQINFALALKIKQKEKTILERENRKAFAIIQTGERLSKLFSEGSFPLKGKRYILGINDKFDVTEGLQTYIVATDKETPVQVNSN